MNIFLGLTTALKSISGGMTFWNEALGTKACHPNSYQRKHLCHEIHYCMKRVLINGLLSNPKDVFARDPAGV